MNTVLIERNNTRSSIFPHKYIRGPKNLSGTKIQLFRFSLSLKSVPGIAVFLPDEFFQPSLINAGDIGVYPVKLKPGNTNINSRYQYTSIFLPLSVERKSI